MHGRLRNSLTETEDISQKFTLKRQESVMQCDLLLLQCRQTEGWKGSIHCTISFPVLQELSSCYSIAET